MSERTYTSQKQSRAKAFETKKQNTERRALTMDVKVFHLKIRENELNKTQTKFLINVFLESKWYYNSCIAFGKLEGNQPWKNDYKKKTVVHFDKDKNPIESRFEVLTSASRQEINKKICANCKALKSQLKSGFIKHTRGLRFKSEYNCIPLRQFGNSWKFKGNKIKLAGCSKPFTVSGLEQLQIDGIEFANAELVQRPTGYYILITAYVPKQPKTTNGQTIGIDFGCETSFTVYNEQLNKSEKFNFGFEQSEKMKRIKRKLIKRCSKGFSNKTNKGQRLTKLYRKHCEHRNNQKDDAANKFVHYLKQFEKVVIQDEMLAKWQRTGHGKKIERGVLGRVKATIKQWSTVEKLDKSYPTSKFCFDCYHNNKDLKQWNREYVCPYCGCVSDRDEHAAANMIEFYKLQQMVPAEYRDPKKIRELLINIEKRVETTPSTPVHEIVLEQVQRLSLKHETVVNQ